MVYTNSDLQKIERDISDLQRKIEDSERIEQQAKIRLQKATNDVKYAQDTLVRAQSDFDRAEKTVQGINDEQAETARTKADLSIRLTAKNSEKARATEDIRREEERNRAKK